MPNFELSRDPVECDRCGEVFTDESTYISHNEADHGDKEEDFEEVADTYELKMDPNLTEANLREAKKLLVETNQQELYHSRPFKNPKAKIPTKLEPHNSADDLVAGVNGYNDDPNSFFYNNKNFKKGNAKDRTGSLGEAHDLNDQSSDFQFQKSDSSDLLRTDQKHRNADGSIASSDDWDPNQRDQDKVGRADQRESYTIEGYDLEANDYDLKSMSNIELKTLRQDSEYRDRLPELRTWTQRNKLQDLIEAELDSRGNESRANEEFWDIDSSFGIKTKEELQNSRITLMHFRDESNIPEHIQGYQMKIDDITNEIASLGDQQLGQKDGDTFPYWDPFNPDGRGNESRRKANERSIKQACRNVGCTLERAQQVADAQGMDLQQVVDAGNLADMIYSQDQEEYWINRETYGESDLSDDGTLTIDNNDDLKDLHDRLVNKPVEESRRRAKEEVSFGGAIQGNIDSLYNEWDNGPLMTDQDREDDPTNYLNTINWYHFATSHGLTEEEARQKMKEETGEADTSNYEVDVDEYLKTGDPVQKTGGGRSELELNNDERITGEGKNIRDWHGNTATDEDGELTNRKSYRDDEEAEEADNYPQKAHMTDNQWEKDLDDLKTRYETENEDVQYDDIGTVSTQGEEKQVGDIPALEGIDFGYENYEKYPTKATETKVKASEVYDGIIDEYEKFQATEDEDVTEMVTAQKLLGSQSESIAKSLTLRYGVSREDALEKVYSIEVSNNDRVANTFFQKKFSECSESEIAELRLYCGSDE